ncbi:MAG: cbb3-type cytochrome c oxidase N-terminal domain-containing protein [Myxococcota bacterium]
MTEKDAERDVILAHNYDGIQEYDNPMPKWWINIFIGTVLFGALYLFHYELGTGVGIHDSYSAEVQAYEVEETERLAKAGAPSESSLAAIGETQAALDLGRSVYTTNCESCHGAKGEGLIGPNLTDRYWLHGDGSLMAIYSTVSEGVLTKGMPAWNRVLAPEDLKTVVAYIGTMRGANLEGKAPQGDPITPEKQAVP